MRISDWSSDVCSSDLVVAAAAAVAPTPAPFAASTPANEARVEWPQRAVEPAADGPAPFAVPADPAQVITLTPPAAAADVLEPAPEATPPVEPAVDPEPLAAHEAQVALLEERSEEHTAETHAPMRI